MVENRLRIAEVAPAWLPVPPPGYGGTERVVSVLTEELVARGHDVTLFALEGSRTRADLVCTLPVGPHPDDPNGAIDDACHALVAYKRADEFDVIHDHSRLGPVLGAVGGGITPVTHTLHGRWIPSVTRLMAQVHRQIGLVAISRSQAAANPSIEYAGMVYNGIDLAAHPFRAAKDDYLAFVGRISPEKGPAEALDAAHRAGLPLRMAVKRVEQVEWDYWNQVVSPRLGGDDEVLEQPPDAVKFELLAGARATLFPINWPEPFGLVMAESMACGTPVIARPLGAAPEVIDEGRTGFLCETVDAMVVAIQRAASISPFECRGRVEQRFSAASMAAGYERVFQASVARSRSKRFAAAS